MHGQQKRRQSIRNPAKRKPVTKSQTVRIASAEAFQRSFNPDYYQVIKRISDADTGLRNGSPPGSVE